MRCPKCGYTSFDHLDNCKKCGKDLIEFKERYGIRSVLFPGQMNPDGVVPAADLDVEEADAAVAAATGTAAAVSDGVAEERPTSSDSDDFGFDFMDDSAEDDDLSFDELFEEAPEDEDVEETIEGPRQQGAEASAEEDDFAFDLPDDDTDVEDDFGFDPTDEAAEDQDEEPEKEAGEDPKNPFDQPESSHDEAAPDSQSKGAGHSVDSFSAAGSTADLFAVDPEPEVADLPADDRDEPPAIDAAAVLPSTTESERVDLLPAEAVSDGDLDKDAETEAAEEREEGLALTATVPAEVGLGGRILAFVCDCALLLVVGFCFVAVAEAAMATGERRFLPSSETLIDLSVPYFLVLFFLAFGYFTLFHFLTGQTPGKMLARLRVESFEDEPLLFSQAFLRSVGGLLQILPAGLGFLSILLYSDQRGWNDRLAGTRLVVVQDETKEG